MSADETQPSSTHRLQRTAFNAQPFIYFGIALGSNLEDRLAHLQQAVKRLFAIDKTVHMLAAAPVYETTPVDCPEGSQAFYNTVIEIKSALEPLALLKTLRSIESSLGRPGEHERNTPRTVDLDILYAGDLTLNHPDLVLPHPRMTRRRFVLQPLSDIRPRLVLPNQTNDVAALLIALDSQEPPLKIIAREWI